MIRKKATANQTRGAGSAETPPVVEYDAACQAADEAALLGKIGPLERAMLHWGLEPRHILGSRLDQQSDGSVEVVIVTQGGQRVRYPRDAARVLSAMEKGDALPAPPSGGIFSR